MKLNIPTLGALLQLSNDWTFQSSDNWANNDLAKKLYDAFYPITPPTGPYGSMGFQNITLPKGSIFKVSRLQLKKGHTPRINFVVHIPLKGSTPIKGSLSVVVTQADFEYDLLPSKPKKEKKK